MYYWFFFTKSNKIIHLFCLSNFTTLHLDTFINVSKRKKMMPYILSFLSSIFFQFNTIQEIYNTICIQSIEHTLVFCSLNALQWIFYLLKHKIILVVSIFMLLDFFLKYYKEKKNLVWPILEETRFCLCIYHHWTIYRLAIDQQKIYWWCKNRVMGKTKMYIFINKYIP